MLVQCEYHPPMSTSPTFSELLLQHYLDWQRRKGSAGSRKAFAEYLGISESYFSIIWNGRRSPPKTILVRLANRLDDPRFYDLGNLPHPDPLFTYVAREWPNLKAEEQLAIRDQIAGYRAGDDDGKKPTTA